jgi:aminopeptidase N
MQGKTTMMPILAPLLLTAMTASARLTVQPAPEDEHLEAWYKQHLSAAWSRLEERESRLSGSWDWVWAELDLEPDLNDASLVASAEICFRSMADGQQLLEVDFLSSMIIDNLSGAENWTHQNDILTLTLAQPADSAELVCFNLDYHGTPEVVGFGSWDLSEHAGVPVLSTLSEPEGARSWWPCRDTPLDKADSLRVMITVPAGFVGTSNGALEAVDTLATGIRYSWFEGHPITTYLVSLAISNYVLLEDSYVSQDGQTIMPVMHFVYPEDAADAAIDFDVTVPMLDFYSGLWGEYPFVDEKYGHSEFPWGGGMEHQCNTSYGAPLIRGDHAYDRIVAHELAHQWWGDMITCATWQDIWLNEGFATYSEALWAEYTGGGHAALISFMNSRCYVTDPSGPIYDPPSTFNSNTVYRKGAWLLHMLRGQLGDAAFFQMLSDWGDSEFQYASATSQQFIDHVAAYTSRELDGLWNGYLYGLNRPSYVFAWNAREVAGQPAIEILLEQQQGQAAFDLYLHFAVTQSGGTQAIMVHNSLRSEQMLIAVDEAALGLELDPEDWLLEEHQSGVPATTMSAFAGRLKRADGNWAGPEAELRLLQDGLPAGSWLSCDTSGIFYLRPAQDLPGWIEAAGLQLEARAADGESLLLNLPAPSVDWNNLGELQLLVSRPDLGISHIAGQLLLEWTPMPSATEYRVEELVNGNWQTLAFSLENSLPLQPQANLGQYRVIALLPDGREQLIR